MNWVRKQIGWVAGTTVGVMVLWLIGTGVSLRTMHVDTAGILFGRNIPLQTYLEAHQAVTHQAILRYGDKYHQQVGEAMLDRMAWERLTLLAEAKRQKIRVSDPEVIRQLQNWPIFQKNGQFDLAGYEAIVHYSLGASPRIFEEEVRQSLLIAKLEAQAAKVSVTEKEIKEAFHRKEDSIKVRYLILPSEAAAREVAEAARQDPQQMEKCAEQWHLPIATSDFVKSTSTIPDLGAAGSVFGSAFGLEPGHTTSAIQVSKGWLIARIEERRPADEEGFPAMKEALEKEMRNQKQLMAYFTWYTDLLKRADLKTRLPEQTKRKKGAAQGPVPTEDFP